MLKWDGHTHSSWCGHGSGEPTRRFVEQAVELGFERYSLTEHGPVPPEIGGEYPPDTYTTPTDDLDRYLDEAYELRAEFADRIDLRPGLEIDFFHGAADRTAEIVERYGARMLDGLLSVHFLPVRGGYRMLDYSPEDLAEGLVAEYGSVDAVHEAYWRAVWASVETDLGPDAPSRIGHPGLPWKFRSKLSPENPVLLDPLINDVLRTIRDRGFSIDVDAAGLRNPLCGQTIPSPDIIARARGLEIPLVFGSDAHAVKHVGWGWDDVAPLLDA